MFQIDFVGWVWLERPLAKHLLNLTAVKGFLLKKSIRQCLYFLSMPLNHLSCDLGASVDDKLDLLVDYFREFA